MWLQRRGQGPTPLEILCHLTKFQMVVLSCPGLREDSELRASAIHWPPKLIGLSSTSRSFLKSTRYHRSSASSADRTVRGTQRHALVYRSLASDFLWEALRQPDVCLWTDVWSSLTRPRDFGSLCSLTRRTLLSSLLASQVCDRPVERYSSLWGYPPDPQNLKNDHFWSLQMLKKCQKHEKVHIFVDFRGLEASRPPKTPKSDIFWPKTPFFRGPDPQKPGF